MSSQDHPEPGQSVSGSPVYDFYDEERAGILAQLHERLGGKPVPASLWALVQVCDIEKLKDLVKGAEFVPDLIMAWACTCSLIPKNWNQKHRGPQSRNPTPESSPVHKRPRLNVNTCVSGQTSPGASSPLPGEADRRDKAIISLAKERDHGKCILTGDVDEIQGAHIFPYSLLSGKSPTSDYTKATPDLWRMLRIFWSDSTVDEWRKKIFSGVNGKANDGAFNVITLQSICHAQWTKGKFGLRPVDHGRHFVTVRYLRLPKVQHGHYDLVELTQRPGTDAGRIVDLTKTRTQHEPVRAIEHGEEFTITTEDPVKWPLPHVELLEMHWRLNAVVALSAAAEPQDLDYFPDDDDNCDIMSDVWWRRGFGTSPYEPTSEPTSPPRSSPKKPQATNTETEVEMEAEAEGLEEDLDSDEHSRGCI